MELFLEFQIDKIIQFKAPNKKHNNNFSRTLIIDISHIG